MKVELYKNIDLLRIPIKAGVSEYYFPQNVDWADAKIDRIAVCVPSSECKDPMDGTTPVLTKLGDLYFNICSADQREIMHAVSAEHLLHTNNYPLRIDSKLDLSQCSLYFKEEPQENATLLLYVYHGSKYVTDYDMPARSVTIEFPLGAGEEINLQQVITTYIHALPATVKGVAFWTANDAPAYFTLRDYKLTYILQNLHTELAHPMGVLQSPVSALGVAKYTQLNGMLFDDININFQYSSIRNASESDNIQKVTILY